MKTNYWKRISRNVFGEVHDKIRNIKKLSGLHYNLIWPDSAWEEVGFTERPLWINNKGWGYIAEDEPCDLGEIEAISEDKWKIIKEKLQNKMFKYKDIENTSLIELEIISYNYGEAKKR